MEIRGVMPVLRVADMDRSVAFYRDVLGFSMRWRASGDGGGENAMLEHGAARLMLSTGEHLGGPPRLTGTLYFDMVGVEALWERIGETCERVWPLEEMDYGTLEFGIRDPDGYTLAFSEEQ
jgi:uncharacterized glyoxalase superfamily protein PhnB